MREQVLRLAVATAAGPPGTFVILADAKSPERFVQWIREDGDVIRIEVPVPDDTRAKLAASLGYRDDVPNFAQEVQTGPEKLADLVLSTVEVVLGGIPDDALTVTFERGEELVRTVREGNPVTKTADPIEPVLLCFRRPDGRSGWAIARDAADYVRRLEAGEYGSRAVPAGSSLVAAVDVDNAASFSMLRDILNRDPDLAAAAMAVLEGAAVASDDPPAARILSELTSAPISWDQVASDVLQLSERHRSAPSGRRKQADVTLRAAHGDVEITRVVDVDFGIRSVTRTGTTTWLHGATRETGPILQAYRSDGDAKTFRIGQRASWLVPGPEDTVAAIGFREVTVVRLDGELVTMDVPADVRAVQASRLGIVAALRDQTVLCWSWAGDLRWRTEPLKAQWLGIAVTDEATVVIADGRLLFVEDQGLRMQPAPRVPRNDSWDSVEATTVGVRASEVYVAFGSAFATLRLNPVPQWSERRSTDEFLSTMVGDLSGEIVAFAGKDAITGKEATTVFKLDGSVKTAPKTRRVSGGLQHNAVLTDSRMLIHGQIDSGADGADVFDLRDMRVTHQLALNGRARIVGAWAEGDKRFGVAGGSTIFIAEVG